jgi:adenylate cyclase
MSVFFSDVRGFTTISEKLEPQALSDVLNKYLTPMTEIVFKNRGTLDKYMGDAIMAFFGAPIHFPDHADAACLCALESLKKLSEIQKEFEKEGLPHIDIGIGINTSDMSVGNMGSDTVRSYTVMGDAVNLGSRLEGITKEYGVRIVISEFTKKQLTRNFITRELDWVKVKGKTKPVVIHELLGVDRVEDQISSLLAAYNEAYEHYRAQNFSAALEGFKKALLIVPQDGPSQVFLERCEYFMNNPPPSDWDGVYTMNTK